ncbi:MAG: tRNA (guanosine(37)-N1)-methyltransferase TrmD [Erysipelotrichaceae bacterium]|nr:tRNA (guanosine(37)-N1)-methyltransferase TrmD [Erysipelotrichaceae bacterium]
MKIRILSICPEQFDSFLKTPLISRNMASGLLDLKVIDIRDYAEGSFRKVDDSPYGGGPGMVMRCQLVLDALKDVRSESSRTIILSPIGQPFRQEDAHRLSMEEELILICGHYEGMDARIYQYADELISIGDYILTGGELPSMAITDAVMRLVDGSMKKESTEEESFEEGLLEYPQYTRPADLDGDKVPEILLSGDHEAIRKWRHDQALELTKERRPDLIRKNKLLLVDEELKEYIEEEVLPCYREYEDGHGIDHIRKVIRNSMELISDLDVDVSIVYCVAAYHDIGIRYGRDDHETTSAKWLYEDRKLERWFTKEQKILMKEAIEDHRASRKEKPRSIYGCIIAEADRDVDPETVIERCVSYALSRHPEETEEEACSRILRHIQEKYGEEGYLKLWMPSKKNEEGLATLRRWLKNGEIIPKVRRHLEKRNRESVL